MRVRLRQFKARGIWDVEVNRKPLIRGPNPHSCVRVYAFPSLETDGTYFTADMKKGAAHHLLAHSLSDMKQKIREFLFLDRKLKEEKKDAS